MFKSVVAATALSFFAFAPASAAPLSSTMHMQAQEGLTSNVIEVQNRRRARQGRRDFRRGVRRGRAVERRRYRPGGRYRAAPRGWRRHSARPRDWRTRGCVVVGPIWFCP